MKKIRGMIFFVILSLVVVTFLIISVKSGESLRLDEFLNQCVLALFGDKLSIF